MAIDDVDQIADFLLGQRLFHQAVADHRVMRQQGSDLHPARRGVDHLGDHAAFRIALGKAGLDLGVQGHDPGVQRRIDLAQVRQQLAFARLPVLGQRQVVEAEHDVLRGHDDRLAVGGREDVVGGHHQHAGFQLGLEAQGHVHGHLVAVEVGVEGRADQRVQLDGLALDQLRLEGLDAEAVQGRRAVQQHRMLADHFLEHVPDLGLFPLHHALGLLHGAGQALGVQARIDERLEQLQRHLLRQAALVQLQLGTHDDHRTAGIVDALAQQVLAEAPLLALQHVGQRLQRALVGTGDDPAAAAVVEQGVHRLLQHPLLVADDDVRRAQLDQPLQAVVPVDHPAVEVVQVGGGEAAAVQRHQRTQLRRDHRHDGHDHPFRAVAGLDEGLDDLQALGRLLLLHFRRVVRQLAPQAVGLLVEVDGHQQVADRLGADLGGEAVVAELVLIADIVILGQQLVLLQGGEARLGDDVLFEVQDPLDVLQRHVEHHGNARRQGLQEPDVGDGGRQLDMAHPLAADAGERDFNAALLADDALVLHPLVLAAQALVVLGRPEDAGAEQAVALGLEGPVVDRLGLLDLPEGPAADLFRAGEGDADLVEGRQCLDRIEDIQDFLVHRSSSSGALARLGCFGRRAPAGSS